jgi:hypothetical protein
MRCAVSDLGVSPALVLYGEQLAIPGIFLPRLDYAHHDSTWDFVNELQNNIALVRNYILQEDPVLRGDVVQERPFPFDNAFIVEQGMRGSLVKKLRGPYPVVEIEFPTVTLRTERGERKYNMDMLRGAYKLPDPLPEEHNQPQYPIITPNNMPEWLSPQVRIEPLPPIVYDDTKSIKIYPLYLDIPEEITLEETPEETLPRMESEVYPEREPEDSPRGPRYANVPLNRFVQPDVALDRWSSTD